MAISLTCIDWWQVSSIQVTDYKSKKGAVIYRVDHGIRTLFGGVVQVLGKPELKMFYWNT